MAKNGKALEQLVTKIQEVIKDRKDITIETNVHLKDRDGVLREFDVIVRTTFQGLPSVIAFECKDYSRPITVQQIDGLNTKYKEVPEITQAIFVSQTGYSKNARTKANSFGIVLLSLEDISLDSIVNQEVTLLKSISKLGEVWYYYYDNNQEYESREIIGAWDSETDECVDLLTLVKTQIHKTDIFQKMIELFVRNGRKPLDLHINIDINGRLYTVDNFSKKHYLHSIKIPVTVNFEYYKGQAEKAQRMIQGTCNIDAVTYGFNNKNIKVQSISTDVKRECFIQKDGKYINPQFKIEVWDKGWK